MSTLLVYASAREVAPLANIPLETLEVGVGKIAATMNLTAALAKSKPDAVLLAGVCGAYPQRHLRAQLRELDVGSLALVGTEVSSDDGVLTPEGFIDLAKLELGDNGAIESDGDLTTKVAEPLDCPVVAGATVSTAAGTDPLSQAHALRSGAQVETMEGAAIAAVCRRFEVPFVELRAVSNRTGDRERGAWDLDGATAKLAEGLSKLFEANVLP